MLLGGNTVTDNLEFNMNKTTDARNALMSARAKNRKAALALLEAGVKLPKNITAHMKAIEDWTNKQLAA